MNNVIHKGFMDKLIARNMGEVEFHQAVYEVTESLLPFIVTPRG